MVPNTTSSSWFLLMDDPSVGENTNAPLGKDLSAGGEAFLNFLMNFCFVGEDFCPGEDFFASSAEDLSVDKDPSVSSPLFDILLLHC